jgi:hypothetical protein
MIRLEIILIVLNIVSIRLNFVLIRSNFILLISNFIRVRLNLISGKNYQPLLYSSFRVLTRTVSVWRSEGLSLALQLSTNSIPDGIAKPPL